MLGAYIDPRMNPCVMLAEFQQELERIMADLKTIRVPGILPFLFALIRPQTREWVMFHGLHLLKRFREPALA